MRRLIIPSIALVLLAMTTTATTQQDPAALLARARALHKQSPLIDGHNDYPWALRENAGRDLDKLDIAKPQPSIMTDIPRLRSGGVGGQFWSVYVPSDDKSPVTSTLEQIDIVHRMMRKYPETFELALTADDVERAFKKGKIASLIGMEGGHSIDNSLGALRMFYRLGARYMTLTHSRNTAWADAATDTPAHNGLSPFGREVVREMNWLGMLVDLSHVWPGTMTNAINESQAPVIFSHSSARAICDVPRNVPDHVLEMLPKNGGVVMVTFVPGFLSQKIATWNRERALTLAANEELYKDDPVSLKRARDAYEQAKPDAKATIADAADHIDHIKKIAGIDHIGLGGDFDGITSVPEGLEDVSTYPALTAELLRRGYKDDEIKKILGLNVLRVMREAERVAARLQKERPPSPTLFTK